MAEAPKSSSASEAAGLYTDPSAGSARAAKPAAGRSPMPAILGVLGLLAAALLLLWALGVFGGNDAVDTRDPAVGDRPVLVDPVTPGTGDGVAE